MEKEEEPAKETALEPTKLPPAPKDSSKEKGNLSKPGVGIGYPPLHCQGGFKGQGYSPSNYA